MISVWLVDDHPLMREGLTATLEAEMDLEVTETAGSGKEAQRRAVIRTEQD